MLFLWFVVWVKTYISSVSTATLTYRWPNFYCVQTSIATLQAKDMSASLRFVGIFMAIIRFGLVPRLLIVVALPPLASQLCLVAINSLSTRPKMWWNIWPPDDWCSWPSTGCHFSNRRNFRPFLSVGGYFDGSGCSKLLYQQEIFTETSNHLEYSLWRNYKIWAMLRFGLLTILLRFWTIIYLCWLDVMYQPRSSVFTTRIILGLMINAGVLLASSRRLT